MDADTQNGIEFEAAQRAQAAVAAADGEFEQPPADPQGRAVSVEPASAPRVPGVIAEGRHASVSSILDDLLHGLAAPAAAAKEPPSHGTEAQAVARTAESAFVLADSSVQREPTASVASRSQMPSTQLDTLGIFQPEAQIAQAFGARDGARQGAAGMGGQVPASSGADGSMASHDGVTLSQASASPSMATISAQGVDPMVLAACVNEGIGMRSYHWGEALWVSNGRGSFDEVFITAVNKRAWDEPDWMGGGFEPGKKASTIDVASIAYAIAAPTIAPRVQTLALGDSYVVIQKGSHFTHQLGVTGSTGVVTYAHSSGSFLGGVFDDSGAATGESINGTGLMDFKSGFSNAQGTGWAGSFITGSGGTPWTSQAVITATDGSGDSASGTVSFGILDTGIHQSTELASATLGSLGLGASLYPEMIHVVGAGNSSFFAASERIDATHAGLQMFDTAGTVTHAVSLYTYSAVGNVLSSQAPHIAAATDGTGYVYALWSDVNTVTNAAHVNIERVAADGSVSGISAIWTGTSTSQSSGAIDDYNSEGYMGSSAFAHQVAVNGQAVATVFTTENGTTHTLDFASLTQGGVAHSALLASSNDGVGNHALYYGENISAITAGATAGDWAITWAEQQDRTGADSWGDIHYYAMIVNQNGGVVHAATQIGHFDLTAAGQTWTSNAVAQFSEITLGNGNIVVSHATSDGAGGMKNEIDILDGSTLANLKTIYGDPSHAASHGATTLVAVDACTTLPNGGFISLATDGTAQVFQQNGTSLYDQATFLLGTSTVTTGSVTALEFTSDSQGIHAIIDNGGTMWSSLLTLQSGTTGLNLTLPGGNNLIEDTSFADTIVCGSGSNKILTTGGADVFTAGSGADTFIIGMGRTVDSTHATVIGFDGSKDIVDLSDFLTSAQLDATHVRLQGGNTSDVMLQVSKNGDGTWVTVVDLQHPTGSSNGGFDGTSHATDGAHLDAALAQWEASGAVKGS